MRPTIIACFDVHYFDDHTNAAVVLLDKWSDATAADQIVARLGPANDYVAGSFYQRELEPLLKLIDRLNHNIETFVIDAYCHLSPDGEPGLGQYLHEQLPDDKLVIGVAKNRFRDTTHAVELLRGDSIRPLFVSAIGLDYQSAAENIKSMHGKNRFPTILKLADQMSRDGG